MKPGETLEAAIWLDGGETSEQLRQFKADMGEVIGEKCQSGDMLHGPLRFIEKQIGEDRVPPVPDHIQGLDVRLMVVEADITGYAPQPNKRVFVGDLEPKDLQRLRVITRTAYEPNNLGQTLTDIECDDVIEELGPDSALRTLGSTVH